MYNKTTIKFVFCLGKYNQPRPPASADYTCLDLDYSGYLYHKSLIQLLFINYHAINKNSLAVLSCNQQVLWQIITLRN